MKAASPLKKEDPWFKAARLTLAALLTAVLVFTQINLQVSITPDGLLSFDFQRVALSAAVDTYSPTANVGNWASPTNAYSSNTSYATKSIPLSLFYHSGWEGGNSFEFGTVTGSPTTQTSIKHSGAYAMRCNTSSATAYMRPSVVAAYRVSFWLYIASTPSVNCYICGVSGARGIVLNTDRTISFNTNDSTKTITGTTVLSTGTWYRISFSTNFVNSNKLYLDGTQEGSTSGAGDGLSYADIGVITSCTADLYFDDVALDNTTSNTNDIGDIRTVLALPSGTGNYNDWDTHASVAEPNNYQNIDDAPGSISDADYEEQAGSSQTRDTFSLPDVSTLSINSYQVVAARTLARMKTSASTTNLAGITVRDNSVDYNSLKVMTTTATWFDRYDKVQPNGSAAWTNARWDAFTVGAISTGSTRDTFLYALMVMVAYQVTDASLTHTFSTYGITGSGTITHVTVGTEAFAASSEKIGIEVTWDGGSNWATKQLTSALPGADPGSATYYEFTSATTWDWTKLNNTNFKVRITYEDQGSHGQISLDWLPVQITYSTGTPDISNSPTSWSLGTVQTSTTYWSSGSAPSFPLDNSECYFAVTNNGAAVNITIHGHNWTGGVGWTLGASPGENIVKITAFKSGDGSGDGKVITTSDQAFISNLANGASIEWELKIETPSSFTDGTLKTGEVVLVGTLA